MNSGGLDLLGAFCPVVGVWGVLLLDGLGGTYAGGLLRPDGGVLGGGGVLGVAGLVNGLGGPVRLKFNKELRPIS